jgi:hypothetical protein
VNNDFLIDIRDERRRVGEMLREPFPPFLLPFLLPLRERLLRFLRKPSLLLD